MSSSPPRLSLRDAGAGYIEHTVSKFDTLAGVAIKYGVEVADIRKMNGLVTDHQMFALPFLQIPLPGRHPPSHSLSNASISPRYLFSIYAMVFLCYMHILEEKKTSSIEGEINNNNNN